MAIKNTSPSPKPRRTRATITNPRRTLRRPLSKPAPVQRAPGTVAMAAAPDALTREIALLRASVDKLVAAPALASGSTDEINAIRRVVTDILESRIAQFLQKLASIRHMIPLDAQDITGRIDALLGDMGGLSFAAERLEHLDPVIHAVGREVQDAMLPDGVIVETIRPGWRTARGQVLARAIVSLNRRA